MILELGDKRKILAGIILLVNSFLLAHNPNEAFFTISTDGNYTEVLAELPWSVRNDLILFDPELENSQQDQDFMDSFKIYIQEKLILSLQSGERMPLVSVEEEEHNGHSHQNNFRITYQGSSLYQVENTILFASYENQKNHHFLSRGSEKLTYITHLDAPSFVIGDLNSEQNTRSKYWIVLTLILFPILVAFYLKKKSSY